MRNEVQLIAYVDRLGGTLRGIHELLTGPFAGLFGGIHLLPFFDPIDGADAGFDPCDHTEVDRRLGGWNDIGRIASGTEVMADLIVNHISCHSPQFLDCSAKGSGSDYDGLFLTLDRVFPQGVSEQELLAIYRPRPSLPFTPMTLADGSRRVFWTTFTAEQIDIDVRQPQGHDYLLRILHRLADSGVSIVRLDAIGYAVKKPGTSCFLLPETFAFIDELAARARELGLEILVEVHSYHRQQIDIARQVDWVYDFALPPLALHTMFSRSASALKHWIAIRPRNAVTVLDTHDGIGVIDIGADASDRDGRPGLVSEAELGALVEQIHANSNGESRQATGGAAANLDLYQVNCTFYSALGRNDLQYLLCRAIQFFLPGIPQVYYVGLLAGANDMALLRRTNVGRDINRHYYSSEEIGHQLARGVVAKLCDLIRLRNRHPAFAGEFALAETTDDVLDLSWCKTRDFARLRIDLAALSCRLEYSGPDGGTETLSLTGGVRSAGAGPA
jgi:sucrose phosphorylase